MEKLLKKIFGSRATLDTLRIALMMTGKSVIFAALIAALWFVRHRYFGDWNFNDHVNKIAWGLFTPLTTIFVFISSVALKNAMDKRSELLGAVRTNDKKEFMNNVNVEIPFVIDYFLSVIGGLILGSYFLLDVEPAIAGLTIVFVIAFVLYFMRQVAMAFDNPLEGVWKMKCIDPAWVKEVLENKSEGCQ